RAVDQDAARHAGGDGGGRVPHDAAPPTAPIPDLAEPAQVGDAEVARDGVLRRDLDAPLAHAVDLRGAQAGICEGEARRFQRRHLLGATDVLREWQLPDPDDGGLVAQRHERGCTRERMAAASARGLPSPAATRYPAADARPARAIRERD